MPLALVVGFFRWSGSTPSRLGRGAASGSARNGSRSATVKQRLEVKPLHLAVALALTLFAAPLVAAEISIPRRELLRQPDAWYASAEARSLADNIVAQQSKAGGWTNWTNEGGMLKTATAEELSKITHGSIDDGATTTQLKILARVLAAAKAAPPTAEERVRTERHRAALLRGVDFLLAAQYANGGWPQHFPPEGYRANITFNDDATYDVITLLRAIADGRDPLWAWIDAPRKQRVREAVTQGIHCILEAQVVVNGKKTGWGAQHDPKTLAPAAARKFEPASLSGHETVGLVRLLMTVEPPTPEVVGAVQAAVAWLEEVKVTGLRLERFESPEGRDTRVVADPSAPPLWARFYEIGTNRPIFAGRDAVIKYSMAEIERERRGGYGWYSDRARDLLAKEYPAWAKKWVRR